MIWIFNVLTRIGKMANIEKGDLAERLVENS